MVVLAAMAVAVLFFLIPAQTFIQLMELKILFPFFNLFIIERRLLLFVWADFCRRYEIMCGRKRTPNILIS